MFRHTHRNSVNYAGMGGVKYRAIIERAGHEKFTSETQTLETATSSQYQ